MSTLAQRTRPEPGFLLAQRYRLTCTLKASSDTVWRAQDHQEDRLVVVKFGDRERARHLRESSMLRRVRDARVVRLLEQGYLGNRPYLILEHIEAEPFPGGLEPITHEAHLRKLILEALEALAALHVRGVIHADLKPEHALVSSTGALTLIDFDLALEHLDVTKHDAMTGTPRYMAPELLRGGCPSPRADLYALGLMCMEVLGGELGGGERASLLEITRARLVNPPHTRLHQACAFEWALQWLRHLLAEDPTTRPASAVEALDLFNRSCQDHSSRYRLPWLGSEAHLNRAVELLEADKPVALVGPPGSGKTRALEEVMARWSSSQAGVIELGPALGPFQSLWEASATAPPGPEVSLQESARRARQLLLSWRRDGALVVADDWGTLDLWTRRALCQRTGALLTSSQHPDALEGPFERLRLPALSEEALRCVFEGPEPGFHLQRDGAQELWRRTGGSPRRVQRELVRWLEAGFAQWTGERVRVHPHALARLLTGEMSPTRSASTSQLPGFALKVLSWLELLEAPVTLERLMTLSERPRWEVEAALELLTRGDWVYRVETGWRARWRTSTLSCQDKGWRICAHERILEVYQGSAHPVQCRAACALGRLDELVEIACHVGSALDARGASGRALLVIEQALLRVRGQGMGPSCDALLECGAGIALACADPDGMERLLQALERDASPRLRALEQLVELALCVIRSGQDEYVLERLEALPVFARSGLELRRQMYRVHAAVYGRNHEQLEVLLAELEPWVEASEDPEVRGSVEGWRGALAYRQGHFERAALHHARAAELKKRASAQLSSWINSANAWLDGLAPERALEQARRARECADELRLTHHELQALVTERAARYRLGDDTLEPWPELLEALALLGSRELEARALLGEAGIAWRAKRASARELAARAEDHFQVTKNQAGALLAGALEQRLATSPETAKLEHIEHLLETCSLPRVRAQVSILLWQASPNSMRRVRARQELSHLSTHERTCTLELLCPARAFMAPDNAPPLDEARTPELPAAQ